MYSTLIFSPDSKPETIPNAISLGHSGYWASPEILFAEAGFYNIVRKFQTAQSTLKLDADKLACEKEKFIAASKSRIDKAELDEQLCAVFRTFNKSALLSVITGPPGAAKSTIAGLWTQFVRMQFPAMPVVLIAKEKTALDRLYDKINFDGACAWTVETALQRDWPREAAIIIDEAGILGTTTMSELLIKADKADTAKVILIGDDKQLVPNAPGQPFRWLCTQNETDKITLTQSFRQKTTELRQAVKAIYTDNISAALEIIPLQILAPENILQHVRSAVQETTADKTLIIVHGPDLLIENLQASCPGYRVLSLAASQGLAVDRAIFVIGKTINCAEFLVGCSRQRYALEILVDAGIYNDAADLANGIDPCPVSLMALDLIDPEKLLALTDI